MDLQTEGFVGACRRMHCAIHTYTHPCVHVRVRTYYSPFLAPYYCSPEDKCAPLPTFVGFGWFGADQFNLGLAKKQLAGFFLLLTVSFFVSYYSRIKAES